MHKRRAHHLYTKLRWVRPVYFLVTALVSVVICVFALRANNQHMVELRQAVYVADKDNTDVQEALRDLQNYVTTHMNTELTAANTSVYPPIQLKYTYERLVKAQTDATGSTNSKVYNDAQHYCEQQNPNDVSGRNRVPCIEKYVQEHDTQYTVVPAALYQFSFASPRWSPDLAGWSMLIAIVSSILFVITFITKRLLK